jgi:hypothetical protein
VDHKKLKLLCRSCKRNIEIHQCRCCSRLRITYGPLSFILTEKDFAQFKSVIFKTLEENRLANAKQQLAFRLSHHAVMNLYFDEVCDFYHCLEIAHQQIGVPEEPEPVDATSQTIILN